MKKPANLPQPKSLLPKQKIGIGGTGSFYVMNVVVNADLRIMHDGMTKLLKKFMGYGPEDVAPGNAVLFVNPAGKYMKMLVGNGTKYPVIAAYHFPPGQKFPLEAVRDIAHCFKKADKVDANKTLKLAMEKYYAKKARLTGSRNTTSRGAGRSEKEATNPSTQRGADSNGVRQVQAHENSGGVAG